MSGERKHHVIRRVLLVFLGTITVLAVLLAAALHSETAFRIALESAQPFIPGTLRYERIDGTLAGPVRAANVNYAINGTVINAGELAFDISPLALLAGRVSLDQLHAESLTVTLPSRDEPDPGGSPPDVRDVIAALALPVHILVREIDIDGFALQDAGGNTLLELDAFRATLDWDGEKMAVSRLDAAGPKIDVTGNAMIGLENERATAIDLEAGWRGDAFPLAASVKGDGNTQRLDLVVEFRQPGQALLNVQLRDLLGTPRWQGTMTVDAVQPSDFNAGLPDIPWSGRFSFDGDPENTRVEGSTSGGWPPATDIELAFEAVANTKRVRVDSLHASSAALAATLQAKGELHYAEGLAYSAEGSVDHFAWPGLDDLAVHDAHVDIAGDDRRLELEIDATAGPGGDGSISVDGELAFAEMRFDADIDARDIALAFDDTRVDVAGLSGSIYGRPESYSAAVQGSVQVNSLPPAGFELGAKGDVDHLVADIRKLDWLNGSAEGQATLAWHDAPRFAARLHGLGFEPGGIDPRIQGHVGGDLEADATLADNAAKFVLRILSLNGEIAGQAITGSGSLRVAGNNLATPGLVIEAGKARLELIDAASGFDFRVDVPALDIFHPDLGGQVRANGHFNGSLASPTLRLQASGNGTSWQAWEAGTFVLDADIVEAGKNASLLHIAAEDVETPFAATKQLSLEVQGEREHHRLRLDATGAGSGGNGEARIAVRGGLEGNAWHGDIAELRFGHPVIGAWELADAAAEKPLRVSADALVIPRHCLQGPSGRACLAIEKNAQDWKADGSLESVPVGIIAGILPPGLEYRGAVSGNFHLESARGIEGNGALRVTEGGIRQASGEGAETLLGWTGGKASVRFHDNRAQAELDIDLLDGGEITGSGRLDLPANATPTVDAEVHAAIGNLQLLPSLIPELSRLQGSMTARLDISGPLDAPRLRGEAQLRNGRARILALGTDWENVTLDLHAAGREISMTGHAESGEGHIDIELDAEDTGKGLKGKARLTGENFKAMHTPEANVDLSPRLALALQDDDLYIDGKVLVPFARIQPRDLSTAVQPSEDQVIVNTEPRAANDGLRIHVAVTTQLGDDVRINALGLKARMQGELTVIQQPGNPAAGNGRLVIAEGEYKAYGQDLTLAKGEIIYTGQPLANPGLDIRAERQPQPDITVGVSVRGPLSQPVTSVYSDPPMSQTEALSWLLFGRSIEQATGEEEGRISEAAIALGLGGQRLLGNVGRKLGVEEIRVEDVGDPERASLVLGKYLSPDLYVSYGIGLFDAVNSFRIRYRISSRWMLEATSGLKSSADFLYTIER